LVAVFAVLGFVKKKQAEAANQAAAEAEAAEVAGIQQQMEAALESGKEAITKGDFRKGVDKLREAKRVGDPIRDWSPEISSRMSDIDRRLEVAVKEIENQEIVEKALEVADSGRLAQAMQSLGKVPESSIFYDRIADLRAKVKERIPARLAQGYAAVGSKDFEAARAAVADVQAIDSGNEKAQELEKAIEAADRKVATGPRKPVEAPKEDPSEAILGAFKAGRLDDAVSQANGCEDAKCKALADKLNRFKDAYKSLDEEGNAEKAHSLLKQLAGGAATPYQAAISRKAAESYIRDGVKAMGSENLPKAFQAFHKAEQIDGDNPVVKNNLRTIRAKASEVFQQSYVDKSSDPDKARRGFELVISITAADDELNGKAKKHLKALNGGD
ncbi:MAG: hypothetical protein ACK4N5_24600, partial [Myxococcales bacterium]